MIDDGGRMLSYEEKPVAPKGQLGLAHRALLPPSVLFAVLKTNQERTPTNLAATSSR